MSLKTLLSLAAMLALIGATGVLGACSTTAGAGQDISATGHTITNTADKAKSGL